MKKTFILLFTALIAVCSFAKDNAKPKKTPESVASKRADKYKKELGLSDEQRTKVYTAVLDKINKVKAVKLKYKDSANRKGRDIEMKTIKSDFEVQMNAILTPDQKVKYEAMKKKDNDDDDDDEDDDNKKGKSEKKEKSTSSKEPKAKK